MGEKSDPIVTEKQKPDCDKKWWVNEAGKSGRNVAEQIVG